VRFTGKLHTWNEERGFGFIRPVDGGQDIFVHVSALPRARPTGDEVLSFEIVAGGDGKKKATDVRRHADVIAALAADKERSTPSARHRRTAPEGSRGPLPLLGVVAAILLVAAAGSYGYREYQQMAKRSALQTMEPVAGSRTSGGMRGAAIPSRCDGRTMCSQMQSCEEATFFLNNCPNTQMDGDHDGVPCEQQWCAN
jgi:cold shock CspA family protein